MSTWTSSAASAAARCLLLAVALVAAGGAAAESPAGPSPEVVVVMNGAIRIAGPAGYCIDLASVRADAVSAFALLGGCAQLGGKTARARQQTVLTASVTAGAPSSAPLSDGFEEMGRFLLSEAGRAALSRVGDARSVRVLSVTSADEVLFVRAQDAGARAGTRQAEADYWRAIFELRGRIVTLTVMGLVDRPVGAAEKRRVLDAFVRVMRKQNAAPAAGG